MKEPSETTGSRGVAAISRLGAIVAVTIVLLILFDVLLRVVAAGTGILQTTVDIQTPTTLYAKLEDFRNAKGLKVAVLGDSLVFGRAMRDKGDSGWQTHTLSSQLQRWLADKHPGQPVSVANFGMNGTLPTDLENVIRIVLPARPDVVVFDLSLRSFSRDFDRDGDIRTRDWLNELNVSADGTYSIVKDRGGLANWLHGQLVNYWFLYRFRDFLQSLLFDGSPFTFLASARNAADSWLRGSAKDAGDDLGDVVLLMRARSRYEKIDLAPDNPQRQALDRILDRLSEAKQPALIFYATENPKVLPELLPRQTFDQLQAQLAQIISPQPPSRVFVGPLAIYGATDFLDHVHLDRVGYRRLSEQLGPRIDEMISQRVMR
jgi:lysophospholipase L1-like esterase